MSRLTMTNKKTVSINKNPKLITELELFIQSNLEGESALAPISLNTLLKKIRKQRPGIKLTVKKKRTAYPSSNNSTD